MKIGNIECYGIIYKITNTINGKCYIGQTTTGFDRRYWGRGKDIEKVYNYYKYAKDNERYVNDHLFSAIEKYGFDAFEVVKVFDIAFSQIELDIKEKHYIKMFDCINKGYNHIEGGNTTPCLKGENNPMHGRPWWDENTPQEKIDEWKSKLHNDGENNPMYGKHHSEETKKKISEANKGKRQGEESPHAKPVICVTTKKIFKCIKDASEYYNANRTSITRCCKGRRKSAGKLPDGTKLVWKFLEDYKGEI